MQHHAWYFQKTKVLTDRLLENTAHSTAASAVLNRHSASQHRQQDIKRSSNRTKRNTKHTFADSNTDG